MDGQEISPIPRTGQSNDLKLRMKLVNMFWSNMYSEVYLLPYHVTNSHFRLFLRRS